jgi:mannose-6-phosphate isomerase-like protein (cupin superfamily)
MWKKVESGEAKFSPYRTGVSNIKRILEQKDDGMKSITGMGLLELPPNGIFGPHTHPDREEIYYVIAGTGTIVVGEDEIPATEGLTVYVDGAVEHGIRTGADEQIVILFVHAQV